MPGMLDKPTGSYELRWMQPRDGSHIPQTHPFDDLKEAKEFAEGLGSDADAELFDSAGKSVWRAEKLDPATAKERESARAANVVGKSEGLQPNTKSDTREDKPQDLRSAMANAPTSQPAQPAKPMDKPTGAVPAGTRQLDADKGPGAPASSTEKK